MRRLNGVASQQVPDRAHRDRGAVAVVVAILMVPIIGFTAIAVDVGALYFERAQLQNGADAAALAVATECGLRMTTAPCVNSDATGLEIAVAVPMAAANANDKTADASLNPGQLSAQIADVVASTRTSDGQSQLQHWFAGVIGTDASTVRARAKAQWGYPSEANVIPLTFPECKVREALAAGTAGQYLQYRFENDPASTPCENEGALSGAIGWLEATNSCAVPIKAPSTVPAETGANAETCPSMLQGFIDMIERRAIEPSAPMPVVLLPIYKEAIGTSGDRSYVMAGFAPFEIAAWKLSGAGNKPESYPQGNANPFRGNSLGVMGKFVEKLVDPASVTQLGGVPLGALVVRLMPN